MERVVPAFTVMSSEVFAPPHPGQCDLAVVDGTKLQDARLHAVLQTLDSRTPAVICVVSQEARFHGVKTQYHRVLPLKGSEEWLGALVVLGSEVLRRQEAVTRVRRADQAIHAHQS